MAGLETATVGVFVNAGARAETDNEHGVAHFLEHMAFKGTATRTPMQIAEEIEGAGGALNAVTSSEATNYYARVLKSDVELGLRLIADLLLKPRLFGRRDGPRAGGDPAGDRGHAGQPGRYRLRPGS